MFVVLKPLRFQAICYGSQTWPDLATKHVIVTTLQLAVQLIPEQHGG